VAHSTWYPDHAGQGHAEPHPLRPLRVDVIVPVLDRGVADAVEDEHRLDDIDFHMINVRIDAVVPVLDRGVADGKKDDFYMVFFW
jgi:hypothetical protein